MLILTLLFIGAVAFLIAGFEGVAWATIIFIGLFVFFGLFMTAVNKFIAVWEPKKPSED